MNAVDTAVDVTALRQLVRPLDPMASVYLGLRPADPTTDSAEDLDLRWRSIRAQLAVQGADEATITAIGRRLADPTSELAVFAAAGNILLAQAIPTGAPFDRAQFAAPPDVVPVLAWLLAWLQHRPPYIVAVIDRTGAEITAVPGGAAVGTASTVVGPDDEIERNAPGGWSQPRYQRRAEDSWQHNAGAVADAVSRQLLALHARLLLVAGDVRAVQLLQQQLPPGLRRDLVLDHLPGGRSPDGSYPARQVAIVEAVDRYTAEQSKALLQRFTERGPRGATVEGAAATLAALAAGQVDTLFVNDDPDDTRTAWYGTQVLCAADAYGIPDGDGQMRRRGRLIDIAVRAALLTHAEVHVVDPAAGQFTDGIGALCRYTPTV